MAVIAARTSVLDLANHRADAVSRVEAGNASAMVPGRPSTRMSNVELASTVIMTL
jgi:hypothetical protein